MSKKTKAINEAFYALDRACDALGVRCEALPQLVDEFERSERHHRKGRPWRCLVSVPMTAKWFAVDTVAAALLGLPRSPTWEDAARTRREHVLAYGLAYELTQAKRKRAKEVRRSQKYGPLRADAIAELAHCKMLLKAIIDAPAAQLDYVADIAGELG